MIRCLTHRHGRERVVCCLSCQLYYSDIIEYNMRIYHSLNKTQDKSDKSDSLRMPLVIVPNALRLIRSSTFMSDMADECEMNKDEAYKIVEAYANEEQTELARAIQSVLLNEWMDYTYLEGLLINFCKCGCVANGLWDEGTELHHHVEANKLHYNDKYTNECEFCNLE